MDDAAFRKLVEADEGNRLKPYPDTKGKISIGIGRNLTDNGLRPVEVDFLFSNDVSGLKAELNTAIPWWMGLSEIRQQVIASMAFNMGVPRLLGFRKMLTALRAGNFAEAAAEILDSDAARELPSRYHRLSVMMEKG